MNITLEFLSKNRAGVLCTLGSFLLSLALSLDYSYPNLNTYVTSYLRKNGHNPDLNYSNFIAVTSAKNLTQGFFSFLGGYISLKLGVKPTIVLGCLTLIAGYTSPFFALESYFWLVVLTIGACHGVAFVTVYSVANGTAQKWFPPERRGLIASIVASGYGFGSVIWIPTETAFINPHNILPVSQNDSGQCGDECDKYFVDETVLERIPYCFLLIGGIITALCLTGVLLVTECKDDLSVTSQELPSLTIKEVLRTKIFYQIWFGFFAVSVTQGLLINWQKSYGLLLVTSDSFHANIGIVTNVCNGVCRIVWGLIYDKIGYKKCIIIISIIVCLSVSSLPLLKLLEVDSTEVRTLWAIIMILLYLVLPGTYAVLCAAVGGAFGPQNFAPNLGLIYTATVAYFSIILVVSQVDIIFDKMGYSGMFLMAGATAAAGLVVTLLMNGNINYVRENKKRHFNAI